MQADRYKIAEIATAALQKMNKATIQETNPDMVKYDFSRLIFEDYDDDSFDDKLKVDNIFYNCLLKGLKTELHEGVDTVIQNMTNVTKQIYEHLNIKPRIYGFHSTSIFNESDDILEKNALRFINDYVNDNYYKLTTEQREKKYIDAIKELATENIINDKLEASDAVDYATKTCVIKDFITRVNFPVIVRDKLEETINDVEYGKIFDQDHLKNLYESFQLQCLGLSKIIAAII